MYNCLFDEPITQAVKQAASSNMRNMRQQFHYYVIQGLQRDGFLPTPEAIKPTGSLSTTDQKPATVTANQTGATLCRL